MTLDRRTATKLLLGVPAAAALAPSAFAADPAPACDLGTSLAGSDAAFSEAERAQVKKAVGDLQKTLDTVRNFKVAPDVSPAFRFAARRGTRR